MSVRQWAGAPPVSAPPWQPDALSARVRHLHEALAAEWDSRPAEWQAAHAEALKSLAPLRHEAGHIPWTAESAEVTERAIATYERAVRVILGQLSEVTA